jgi:hypothetical protein
MATINLKDNQQVIDYLARDYSSFRKALLDLIPLKLPECTDLSEANFGVVLIELFAYMADILSYYQDRLANEMFLSTAQERRNVIEHLRLIGYEMAPAAPAAARLSVIVANDFKQVIEIRKGDQFSTPSAPDRPSQTFEYTNEQPLVIDFSQPLGSAGNGFKGAVRVISAGNGFKEAVSVIPVPTGKSGVTEVVGVVPVREGKSVLNEVIGVSDGSPNQTYRLAQPRVLRDSLVVRVDTTPPTAPWHQRTNLIFSGRALTPEQLSALEQQERIGSSLAFSRAADPDFATETDDQDVTTVLFGDGQYGLIPPAGMQILASYRTGGGVLGNVGAGQIINVVRSPQLQVNGAKVTNRSPASGGADREPIEQAIKYAPTLFSSMQRAVTGDDYIAQARLFPGVSKARAEITNWNFIKLFIAPTGSGEQPSDILKRDLLAYFEDKRMLTVFLEIESPDYIQIEIHADIGARPYFANSDVKAAATSAISRLFDFQTVDFGDTLYLSKIYEVLESEPGIDHLFVSRFARSGDPQDIPSDGRIVLGPNEIPVLSAADLVKHLTVEGGIDATA